jgi:hypothetical protein
VRPPPSAPHLAASLPIARHCGPNDRSTRRRAASMSSSPSPKQASHTRVDQMDCGASTHTQHQADPPQPGLTDPGTTRVLSTTTIAPAGPQGFPMLRAGGRLLLAPRATAARAASGAAAAAGGGGGGGRSALLLLGRHGCGRVRQQVRPCLHKLHGAMCGAGVKAKARRRSPLGGLRILNGPCHFVPGPSAPPPPHTHTNTQQIDPLTTTSPTQPNPNNPQSISRRPWRPCSGARCRRSRATGRARPPAARARTGTSRGCRWRTRRCRR